MSAAPEVDQVEVDQAPARPAGWMYVTPTARSLHYFAQGRGRSACGRYFRNPAFSEAGLFWPEAGRTDDDCWTCRDRLDQATARQGNA